MFHTECMGHWITSCTVGGRDVRCPVCKRTNQDMVAAEQAAFGGGEPDRDLSVLAASLATVTLSDDDTPAAAVDVDRGDDAAPADAAAADAAPVDDAGGSDDPDAAAGRPKPKARAKSKPKARAEPKAATAKAKAGAKAGPKAHANAGPKARAEPKAFTAKAKAKALLKPKAKAKAVGTAAAAAAAAPDQHQSSRSRSRSRTVVSCSAGVDSTQQGGKSYTGPLPIDVPAGPRTTVPHGDGGPAPPEEDPTSAPLPLATATANAWIHIYVDGCIVEAIFNNRTAFVSLANNAAVPAATTVAFLPRSAATGRRGNASGVTGEGGFDGASGEGPLVATATVFQLKPVNNLQ